MSKSTGTVKSPKVKDVSRRKHPSQDRGKRTEEKILSACQSLLESEGPDSLSTKKIAKEAGLSTGSLYEYFPNKESVLCAMVEYWLSDVIIAMDRASPAQCDSALTWVERTVDEITHVYEEQPIVAKFYNSLMAIPALRHIDKNHDDNAARKYCAGLKHFGLDISENESTALARASLFMIHSLLTDVISQERDVAIEIAANLKFALSSLMLRKLY